MYISLSGVLTFKAADALRDAASRIPLDRLLVETDCPFLAPAPHRGKRNEPAYVRLTAERLAEVRGVPPAEVERGDHRECPAGPAPARLNVPPARRRTSRGRRTAC